MIQKPSNISCIHRDTLQQIRVVLCDIDDTLTLDGKLPAKAYDALEKLDDAGLIVVPITGRPAGWCDMIARFWPVNGVVGENGAFYFRYDRKAQRMIRRYWKSETEREADRRKLAVLRDDIVAQVPGCAISSDQAYREADLAIDFCEDVAALSEEAVNEIVRLFEDAGAIAKISSIHVNGWFGRYDKLTMTEKFLSEQFNINIESEIDTVAFLGDSPNDAPMFSYFPNSVGVANVMNFADQMTAMPSSITSGEGGLGFAEFAEQLLEARAA